MIEVKQIEFLKLDSICFTNFLGKRLFMKESNDSAKIKLDKFTFWCSLIAIVSLCSVCVIAPSAANETIGLVKNYFMTSWDWMFLLFGIAALVGTLFVAFSKYGNIRLGRPDEKAQYSMISWVAMMFCSAVGSTIIIWSVCEPLYYLATPPFGYEAFSPDAYNVAVAYGMFHWGPIAWAMFALPTLPVAYHLLVRNRSDTKISEVIASAFNGKGKRALKIVDILVVFATFGAIGPGLGLGVPMLSSLISELFNIPRTTTLDLAILGVWIIIFTWSVYQGLDKGIQKLSNINVYLIYAIIIFIFLVGPTEFILQNTVDSLGNMFQWFPKMATFTDPIQGGGFAQSWTVFYWAWYLAFVPLMMVFNAKISRGRTIREFLLGILIVGSIGTILFFMVMGNYTVYLQSNGIVDLVSVVLNEGTVAATIAMYQTLPCTELVLIVLIALYFIFLATCIDSGSYAMAVVTSEKLESGQHPTRNNRLVWAGTIALLGISMFRLGDGLSAIQASVVVLGFPVMFISLVMFYAQWKFFKEDFGTLKNAPPLIKNYYKDDQVDTKLEETKK